MEKFKNKYRIPSARLAGWNYGQPSMYFITICTKNRLPYFGTIVNGEMFLNETGIIANNCWAEIPSHFQNVTLGEFVIMPNHTHGIIIINDLVETGHALSDYHNQINNTKKNIAGHTLSHDDKPTSGLLPPNDLQSDHPSNNSITNETGHTLSLPNEPHYRFRNQGKNTISAMVGSFKSAVTRLSKPINKNFGWQARFHDHIIRSENDYIRISDYIINNPANWPADTFNK